MKTFNIFPPQQWEMSMADAGGLSISQLRFAVSFVASVVVAIILRLLPSPKGPPTPAFKKTVLNSLKIVATFRLFHTFDINYTETSTSSTFTAVRHWYSIITGFLLLYYPFGNGTFNLILPIALTYLFMYKFRQHCGTLTWVFVFSYLLIKHVQEASGLSWKEGDIDFTGALMVLTLKLIAIAVSYQDGNRPQTSLKPYPKSKAVHELPSLVEYLSYLSAAGNLLAGPHIEVKDYLDYIERRGHWDQSNPHHKLPNPIFAGTARFIKALICAVVWLELSNRYPVSALESEKWQAKTPVVERILYLWLSVSLYRFKYYFAWALAECALIFSGLNFQGYDDKGKPHWTRYTNARLRKVECNESLAELPQHWNITTGLWLRHYVYERVPSSKGKPTFTNMVVTQLVSGLWHGLFPGYWMMFITSAFMFESSKVLYRYEQSWSPAVRKFPLWRLAKVVMTATVLNYTAGPFVVLTLKDSWAVWQSVYFFGHIIVFVILLIGVVMPPRRKKSSSTKQQQRESRDSKKAE